MSSTSIEKLLEIMRQLRDPEQGCEWDKKQTFKSLIPYLKEESAEVIEAIEKEDSVSYTNQTLPTILLVYISVLAVSIKKK